VVVFRECFYGAPDQKSGGTVERRIEGMVKRLILLSLLVLALCGASTLVSFAGGAPGGAAYMPPGPPGPPPIGGPASSKYSVVRETITPVPAQLRKVRVVAPYLAGIAWPRTPLPFLTNPQAWPTPVAPGRYEWLVPVTGIEKEHFWKLVGPCCKTVDVPRCVYVKANYVKPKCGPMPCPPPPMPMKVKK
jgi:hypothetical protein